MKNLNLGKMVMLTVMLLVTGMAVLILSPDGLTAAGSSFKFNRAFVGIQARVLALVFNTTTGHDHDGTDSKAVTTAANLAVTGALSSGALSVVSSSGVYVSSSATSGFGMHYLGAYTTAPTEATHPSEYYDLTELSVFRSTETVTGSCCWVASWTQY